MVETYLNGTHLKLPSGITDVSTDRIHAEIKNIVEWKQALGQIYCYNHDSPRAVLQVYLFGKAAKSALKTAYEKFSSLNIELYTFTSVDDTHNIVKYDTGGEALYRADDLQEDLRESAAPAHLVAVKLRGRTFYADPRDGALYDHEALRDDNRVVVISYILFPSMILHKLTVVR